MSISITGPMLLVVLALIAFWAREFVFLMMLDDKSFPGRFDKPLWCAVFFLAAPMAPLLFAYWRRAMRSAAQPEQTKPRSAGSSSPEQRGATSG